MADIINQFGQMENTSELTMDEMTASAQANSTGLLKKFAAMIPASLSVQSIFELSAPEAPSWQNRNPNRQTSSAWAAAAARPSRIFFSQRQHLRHHPRTLPGPLGPR